MIWKYYYYYYYDIYVGVTPEVHNENSPCFAGLCPIIK